MQFVTIAARLLVAAVFLMAGIAKARDQKGFCEALGEFGAPALLILPLGVAIPAVEWAIAAGLLTPGLTCYGAWGALGVLAIFFAGVSVALVRERRPDCHCFGQLQPAQAGRVTLARIAVLAGLAVWLIRRG
jgi:hypothetical protein